MKQSSSGAFSGFGVYTIVKRPKLDAAAATRTKSGAFSERKRWVTGHRLWRESIAVGNQMLVIFGDAAHTSRLLYSGVLTHVKLSTTGTSYRVEHLRRIPGGHRTQELRLRKTGKKIAPGFIRPYAICHTPEFAKKGHAV